MVSIPENTKANIYLTSNDESINGQIICKGKISIYQLNNYILNHNVTYTLSITPTTYWTPINSFTVTTQSNNQYTVQWLDPGTVGYSTYKIKVTGSDGTSTDDYFVSVYDLYGPFITTPNVNECQVGIHSDASSGNIILSNANGCVNVCRNSVITYHAGSLTNSAPNNDLLLLCQSFEWSITGGEFVGYPPGQTTIIGSPTILGPGHDPLQTVQVIWNGLGNSGSISIREHNFLFKCSSEIFEICINKIPDPEADFCFDNYPPDFCAAIDCYEICRNQEVHFKDLSIADFNYPISYWEWDFGDGSPISNLKDPSYTYTEPGTFHVVLKVTNNCGCISKYVRCIIVSENTAPTIECASVVCENYTSVYYSPTHCSVYEWQISGGTQTFISGQPSNEITITWDQVGDDGFGYVFLNGEPCESGCKSKGVIKVPVIQAYGTIKGHETICPSKYYKYSLPKWPATNFNWNVIDLQNLGINTISWTENGNEILIQSSGNLGTFQIRCHYHNTLLDCHGSAMLNVTVRSEPEIIASKKHCVNSDLVCSLDNVPPNTNVLPSWKLQKPNGTIVTFGSDDPNHFTFPAQHFNSPGIYIIYVTNPSQYCDPEPVYIRVLLPPEAPNEIHGHETVCLGYPYSYNIEPLNEAIGFWTITGGYVDGTNNVTTYTGNSVNVIWT